jgi:hypothetical protein
MIYRHIQSMEFTDRDTQNISIVFWNQPFRSRALSVFHLFLQLAAVETYSLEPHTPVR